MRAASRGFGLHSLAVALGAAAAAASGAAIATGIVVAVADGN